MISTLPNDFRRLGSSQRRSVRAWSRKCHSSVISTGGPSAAFWVSHVRLLVCWIGMVAFGWGLELAGLAREPHPQQAGAGSAETIRVGMIGLDTSHTIAFAKIIRDAEGSEVAAGRLRVVAAFPGGSPDIPSSADRVEGYTKELRESGVEIVDSIDALVSKVDAVLLTSLDGRKHLEQVIPVFRAGKPCFIDKPLAGDLADALAIQKASERFQGRWFTASSLRFTPTIWRYRIDTSRKVLGAHSWSPCSLEPHHNDLAWYGIHGVEALYTAMGPGCESVSRSFTDGTDVSVGMWKEGRVGLFRGIRQGQAGYGLTVFGVDFIESDAKYEGYEPLVAQIADFFAGGAVPVPAEESVEMMAFIEAAQRSRERGGVPVRLEEVFSEAQVEAGVRLERLLAANPQR